MNDILPSFRLSGAYAAFRYGFDFNTPNPGNTYVTAKKLNSAQFSDGSPVYPSSLADEGYKRLQIYDPILDNIPLIGIKARGLVKDNF